MKWIKVKDARKDLPMDATVFLAIFSGQFCLATFDIEEDMFWMQWLPGQYDHDTLVSKDRESKFTYWLKLEKPEVFL